MGELVELIKAIGPVLTAGAAWFAAWNAFKGLSKWHTERRAQLAEDVLSAFYEANDIIRHIRSPGAYDVEYADRKPQEDEPPDIKSLRDTYYVPLGRLADHHKFFADLRAKRYRMRALMGPTADAPFQEINKVLSEIRVAAGILMRGAGQHLSIAEKLQATIWEVSDDDPIAKRINAAVSAIEKMCTPILAHRREDFRQS